MKDGSMLTRASSLVFRTSLILCASVLEGCSGRTELINGFYEFDAGSNNHHIANSDGTLHVGYVTTYAVVDNLIFVQSKDFMVPKSKPQQCTYYIIDTKMSRLRLLKPHTHEHGLALQALGRVKPGFEDVCKVTWT